MIPSPTPACVDFLLSLIDSPQQWLRRRVDETELLDPAVVRWTTRLEITLPSSLPVNASSIVLPLFRKSRGLATGFVITTPTGNVVSHLTQDENREWARDALLRAVSNVLSQGLLPRVSDLILRATGPDIAESRLAVIQMSAWGLHAGGSPKAQLPRYSGILESNPPAQDEGEQLLAIIADDRAMNLLAGQVGGHWVMVSTAAEPDKDLVFVVQHENRVTLEESNARQWKPLWFPTGSAKSYHAEVRVPPGVAFRQAAVKQALATPLPGVLEVHRNLVSLYVTGAPVSALADWGNVRSCLRLAEGGVKWPATALALGTLLIFLSGLLLREVVLAHPAAGSAAVLVGAVSLAAAIALQRPASETERLLSGGLRATLYLVITAAAVGAGSLAINWPPGAPLPALDWSVAALAVASVVVAAVAIAALSVRDFLEVLYLALAAAAVVLPFAIGWPAGNVVLFNGWKAAAVTAGLLLAAVVCWVAVTSHGRRAAAYVVIVSVALALPFAIPWPPGPHLASLGWSTLAWALGGLLAATAALVAAATWIRHR